MEMCLSSYRSELYSVKSLGSFFVSLFATSCAFIISLAMVTDLRRLGNGCLDTLLLIDNIKSFLFLCTSSVSFTSLMLFTMSTSRSALFLAENALYAALDFYQTMHRSNEVVASIASLRRSPFSVTSTDNVKELGEDFNPHRLYQRFNQIWSQRKRIPRSFVLFD